MIKLYAQRLALTISISMIAITGRCWAFDEIDLATTFPAVAQGHHGNNNNTCHKIEDKQLEQKDGAKINGTQGLALSFCTVNNDIPNDGCDDGNGGYQECEITESDIRGIKLDNFPNNNSNREAFCGDTVNNDKYKLMEFKGCSQTLPAIAGDYHILELKLAEGAELTLPAGDYWVDTLEIKEGSKLIPLGDVRIFIEDDAVFSSSNITANASGDTILVSYDDIELLLNSELNAYLYTGEELTMKDDSVVNGRVTTNYLYMEKNSVINGTDPEPIPPAINHYQIEFTSEALSCAAKEITLRACSNDNCSTELTNTASVELYKAGHKYSDVSIIGNTKTDLWHTDGGTVLLALGSAVPSGPYRCLIDGIEVDNANCQLTFENTGFYFEVPDTISNKDSEPFELFAVTKDTSTQQCVPLFSNQTKAVDFTFSYEDPSPVNNQSPLTLTAPSESKSIAGGDTESVSVQFDADGKALLTVNYPEAGEVALKASHTHTVTTQNGSEELVLEHQDSFVAKPAGFHFFNASTNNTCDSSDPYHADCGVLAKAGESFDMELKAVGWLADGDSDFRDNPALENFKHDSIQIQAVVEMPSLADGGVNGNFSASTVDFDLAVGKSSQLFSQSWNEVGTVTAAISQDISYLGVTISKEKVSSEVFGRFTPAYLDISASTPSLAHSCGTFTYMDQPFSFAAGGEPIIQVKGVVSDGSEASNYQVGDWWRYKHKDEASRNQWPGRSYEDQTGEIQAQDSLAPALSGSVDYANNSNTATLMSAEVEYVRLPSPIAPFDAKFDLKLAVTDVTDEDGICYKADSSASCQPFSFEDIADGASFELRYGRLTLENGYGPESEALRIPIQTEYVTALDLASNPIWGISHLDSCSIYDTNKSTDSGETTTEGINLTYPSGFPEIEVYTDSPLSSQIESLNSGMGYLFFAAPNIAGEVPFKLHVDPWLKWYWNYDGNQASQLYDPRALANFGTYRGHDRVIQWHEVH